ncbi:sugar diacid utilization regulator [Catenulispora sp. GAS73]|uniref:PucR family transcriptional regulator n=1 Tax=Catenulispora sp. GAS73 TaxID=3156269 RepID=UPI0035182494
MAGDDVQSVVDALAVRLGRSVAVDDQAIRLIAASKHFGDEDPIRVRSVLDREIPHHLQRWVLGHGIADWTAPGRIGGHPDSDYGLLPRLCVPVRCHGVLLGFLWLIDADRDLTDSTVQTAVDAAETIGVILYRRMLLHERERSVAEAALRNLLSPDAEDRRRAAEEIQSDGLLSASATVVVLAVEIDGESDRDSSLALETAVEHVQRRQPPGTFLTLLQHRRAVVVLGSARPPREGSTRDVADRIRARFTELAGPGRRCAVGVSAARPGLESVADAHRQAATAVRAALLLPMFGDVASWSALGPFAMLLRVDFDQLAEELPFPGVRDLLADPANDLLATSAEEFLDRAGDVAASADALHVHRTTMYHRLKRVEAVTGLNLDDGLDRLTLHLALKLTRINSAHRTATR